MDQLAPERRRGREGHTCQGAREVSLTNTTLCSKTIGDAERPRQDNPTIVPDTFWSRVRATFLVRHPALTFPSTLRTAIDKEGIEAVLSSQSVQVQKWECTYRWHLLLYRFLILQHSQWESNTLHQSRSVDTSTKLPLIVEDYESL